MAAIVGVATATWAAGVLLSDEPQELTANEISRHEAVTAITFEADRACRSDRPLSVNITFAMFLFPPNRKFVLLD